MTSWYSFEHKGAFFLAERHYTESKLCLLSVIRKLWPFALKAGDQSRETAISLLFNLRDKITRTSDLWGQFGFLSHMRDQL